MSEFRQIETGGIYHVFNRGVDKRKIFNNNQDYTRFILGLYLFNDVNNKYDIWTSLNFKKQATLNILRPTIGLPGNPIVGLKIFKVACFLKFKLVQISYLLFTSLNK